MFSYKAFVTLTLGTCIIIQVESVSRSLNCECGVLGNTNRIVGGWTASANQFPWLVPILNKNKLYCGGAIINNRYILTAGHCVKWVEQKDITILTGAHEIGRRNPANIYKAQRVILNPHFFSHKMYDENDIALIKVNRPIIFSDIIYPVCLPSKGDIYDRSFATVAGWGKLGEKNKDLPALLQQTVVKVLSPTECANTRMKPFLTRTVMCAFFTKSDSCQGDSGGPLVLESEPGKMEQIGVVSWGIGCGSSVPGIYTKVSEYLDWIYQSTQDAAYCRD